MRAIIYNSEVELNVLTTMFGEYITKIIAFAETLTHTHMAKKKAAKKKKAGKKKKK